MLRNGGECQGEGKCASPRENKKSQMTENAQEGKKTNVKPLPCLGIL